MRRAFTLIEALIVFAILAVLVGLAASGVMKARTLAARADCQNRLRQQVAAIFNYESRSGHLPPGWITGPYTPLQVPDETNHSLWAVLLGDLNQPAAADQYLWEVSYDDAVNRGVVLMPLPVLTCPTQPAGRMQTWPGGSGAVADYGPVDVNPFLADIGEVDESDNFEGALPVNGTVKLAEITDGQSNTLLLVEAAARPGAPWSSPSVGVSIRDVLGGAAHQGGANVATCDGSVHFLKAGTSLKLLAKLATRSGNESLDGEW